MLHFTLDDEQEELLRDWQEHHDCKFRQEDGYRDGGTFGGIDTFTFIPTSVDMVTLVKCACGAQINLSPEHIFFEKLKKQKGKQQVIYYTGDPHGSKHEITRFCNRLRLTAEDTIVVLGDVGANYYGDVRDNELKRAFRRLKPTIFCIHGNHEMRPTTIPTYKTKEWCGGQVWYEEEYPNLLFARDGDIFTIEGLKHLVIGGAYSVDKYYRLMRGYNWWPDEQPSDEIKAYVEEQIRKNPRIDVVLTHTCPYRYEPVEAFLPMINQDSVDAGTEQWLDEIEAQVDYDAWMCGHWHINKRIDKLHFLFHDFESAEQLFPNRDWNQAGGVCHE